MFSDIGKPIRDLLEEDFFFSQKFQFKAKNQSDFVVTGEADFGSRGPMANLSLFRKGSILSLDKLRIKSDGRILAEASLKTSDISTFTVSAEDGRQEPGKPLQSFGKLGVEIRSPTIMAQADVDVVNGPLLKGSFVYSLFKNLSFGAETLVNTHLEERNSYPELTDLNFGVAYSGPNWNLAARTTDTIGTMRFGYLQSISQRLTVGALLIYRLKANAQKLVFGAEYSFGPDSKLKGKIDSNAVVAASFRHQLSSEVQLSVCAEVNVQEWSADSHKFGIGLEFDL